MGTRLGAWIGWLIAWGVMLSITSQGIADELHWKDVQGYWHDPSNWIEGAVPLQYDTAIVSRGTAFIHSAYPALCKWLYIASEADSSGRVEIDSSGASLLFSQLGTLHVGIAGRGTFVQSAGNVLGPEDGMCSIVVGCDEGSEGVYLLEGGTVDRMSGLTVGGRGLGSFAQSGGSASFGTVTIGGSSGARILDRAQQETPRVAKPPTG